MLSILKCSTPVTSPHNCDDRTSSWKTVVVQHALPQKAKEESMPCAEGIQGIPKYTHNERRVGPGGLVGLSCLPLVYMLYKVVFQKINTAGQ